MKAIQTANNGGNSRFSLKNNHYIKLLSNINRTGLFSAFTFLLLALTCLFPISKGEQNTEAVTGTAQSSSLTLNVTGDTASVELDVNSTDGTFASSSSDNSAAFSVVTNNFSGYTLSISGSDNDGKLYDTTKKYFLEPLTSAVSEADFSSTSSLNGKWGYKPSKFNSIANNNYLPAPTTTASTLDTTSVANPTANNYTISLGLRADYGTAANTYTNAFVITAVPNPIAYVITYDANTTDTVSNMPAAQNSTTSATSTTLSDKTPTRADYDFKGWCTTAPTATNPDTCTGTTFQPGNSYGIDQTTENITTLYAIWEEQIAGYIQDYTYARCSSEAVNRVVKLADKRDNRTYRARYINGICTMVDNLDFELTTGMTLTPDTTNVTTTRTLNIVNSLTAHYSDDEMQTIKSNTASYGTYYNYAAVTAGTVVGEFNKTKATEDICPAGWRLPTGDSTGEQFVLNNSYTWVSYNPNYPKEFTPVAAGYYYDGNLNNPGIDGYWWSSTVIDQTDRSNLVYNVDSGLLSGGYRSRGNGFSVRCVREKPGMTISFNANGGTGTMNMQKIDAGQSANLTANTFTRTDYVFTGWNTEPDGSGTSYSNQANYTAPASEDNKIVVLYAQWGKYVGNMQSYTASQCSVDAVDSPVYATDTRDSKIYSLRYINDYCWMTQNLAVDKGQVMTPSDTNIASNYTMPSNDLSLGNSNTEARTHEGNSSTGNWYNLCAATAGEICYSSGWISATQDICPKDWRIPNSNQLLSLANGEYGSPIKEEWITDYVDLFTPVAAGYYGGGSLNESGISGYWWSSTHYMAGSYWGLDYMAGYGLMGEKGGRSAGNGFSIRCILK